MELVLCCGLSLAQRQELTHKQEMRQTLEQKQAQRIEQVLEMTLEEKFFLPWDGTVFLRTAAVVKKMELVGLFEGYAEDNGYRDGGDWLLCFLLPKFRNNCMLFYQGKGYLFVELYPHLVGGTDKYLAKRVKDGTWKLGPTPKEAQEEPMPAKAYPKEQYA